ncbi:MAG: 3-oxoacyl-[acyl-carrier-protein] reductase [Thermacetogeniaceae bacterium]|nr:3-oxoacyl-[acyl-carrier-protein] reductase [Thermoanaerobacterales bacterium]NLN20479.1 3-oxoacyl-[acyl-carrier-protein] reductase [Syntrophomonadaceae bacterium]
MREEVALITGGARGIGKAIAMRLAQESYKVAVCDIASECDDVVQLIKDNGGQALGLSCDITDPLMVKEMIAQIIDTFGRLDILVNNAGIAQDNLLLRISDEEWLQTIKTNLTGTFYCTRAAIRPMLKQKKGRIINISSVVGLRGNAGQSHYAASKAGIIGFTKAIAREYGSRGITANAVAPGYIQTDMTADLPEEYWKDILNSIPLKRPGTAEDIAGVVAFLASPDAAYITGQVIAVDGGLI